MVSPKPFRKGRRGEATDCIQEEQMVISVFVGVPLHLRKHSEWLLTRWYLERSALDGRLLISIFFFYNLSVGTISDVPEGEMYFNRKINRQGR